MSGISPNEIPEGFTAADPNAGGGQAPQAGKAEEAAARKEQILNSILDDAARERLKRIALVKKEKATGIENMLVQVR